MKELNFYWRMGDYALKACPPRLARFYESEPNETIELIKYFQYEGKECHYTIGYFWYDEHEPCWELKFVGERFKEILETDVVAVFKMLASAYDTLTEWKKSQEDNDDS